MGIDFFDKPYGSSNPVKRPYIHKRLDKHQSSFGSTARRTIAESYEADTFAGTSLYIAYALRVDSKPGQRVKVKAWCRKTHPSLKAFAPESYEDNVSIDKFPTYLAIKDSIPAPTPGEKIWVEYGNENLETPRYIGPVNDREHMVDLIKSTSGAGAFGAYPCGALNSSATNVGALGGTTAQGRNVPVSSTGLPQTNRKSSDLTGENVFVEATSAPARPPERASWRKNVAAAGCRESRNWIGKLSGNRNKSVVIHIPGTTDLNLPLETYVWIHGAGGNNPSGRTWEFLPRLSKKMGEAGRNFILIFPVVAPASRHHSGGAEGSIGILVNQSIEVIQTQLAPGTQIQIAYRTIGAHSAGGGIMARSALDPNGLMSYQPDKITLADITGIGKAFTKIWENYMQRVNKAVQLNVLGSGTTFGARGENGPKVEGLIQQFFAKVTPSSTTPSAAYSGDLTLQVQKSNGAIQHITRAKIQGLNHTTYAFAGYEYINPAAARKNSNKTTTTPPAHTDAGPAATILFDSTSRESLREPAVWNFPANGPLPPDWDIRNFGPQTLKSRGDNMVVMHKETLRALDKATTRAASFGHPPIRLTNQVKQGRNGAYRDPELNRREGGKPGSRHKFGNGFDIWTKDFTNEQRMALLGNLYNVGFRGFGHGPNNIHADTSRKRQWNYNNYPVPSWKEIEAGSAAGPGGGKNIGPNPLNPSTGPNPGATTCSTVGTVGAAGPGRQPAQSAGSTNAKPIGPPGVPSGKAIGGGAEILTSGEFTGQVTQDPKNDWELYSKKAKKPATHFVFHDTAGASWKGFVKNSAAQCLKQGNCLGVTFSISAESSAKIRQHQMLTRRSNHANYVNAFAHGVEVVNIFDPDKKKESQKGLEIISAPWEKVGKVISPSRSQLEQGFRLVSHLNKLPKSEGGGLIWEFPNIVNGNFQFKTLPKSHVKNNPGIYAHGHISAGRRDGYLMVIYCWLRGNGYPPDSAYAAMKNVSANATGPRGESKLPPPR